MPDRLDERFLRRECSDDLADTEAVRALRIAHALGPLASRWLAGTARRLAGLGEATERLPATVRPGAFHVLVAVRGTFPVLQPAFPLPLRWGRDREHSRKLPATLLEHADRALELHRATAGGRDAAQWGLSADFPAAPDFDLGGLDIDGPSAMAAMLAALQLAEANIGAVGTVLASVACAGEAWSRVDCIDVKLDAALAGGATRVFLWDGNKAEGGAWERSRGRHGFVRYLRADSTLQESLAPFLKELEAPPPPTASLDDHAEYYERALIGRARGDARRDYYLEKLVEPLARRCHGDLGIHDICGPVRYLVGCVAPGQPPTVALLARLLRPDAVRLVHSPLADEKDGQLDRDIAELSTHLRRESGVKVVERWEIDLVKLPLPELRATVLNELAAITAGDASKPGMVVIDVTNGPKRLAVALLEAAPPGARCVLVDSRQTRSGVHRIGSERIEAISHDRPS